MCHREKGTLSMRARSDGPSVANVRLSVISPYPLTDAEDGQRQKSTPYRFARGVRAAVSRNRKSAASRQVRSLKYGTTRNNRATTIRTSAGIANQR